MLIVCPACASEYEIDAERLGPEGRSVRCASCRETWHVTSHVTPAAAQEASGAEIDPWTTIAAQDAFDAPVPEAPPEIVDHPMPTPLPPGAKPGLKPNPKPAKRGAEAARIPMSPTLAAGLALLACLPLALLGRAGLVQAMPRSAMLFSAIGLPVNLRGIDLTDVAAFQSPAEGAEPAKLVVEGSLRSVAGERVMVPPLAIELRDAHDQVVYRWSAPPPRSSLEPDETARFRASLSAPPTQGHSVLVRFAAERQEAGHGAKDTAAGPSPSADAHADPHAEPPAEDHRSGH